MEKLLEQSRKFQIAEREVIFDVDYPIFFKASANTNLKSVKKC